MEAEVAFELEEAEQEGFGRQRDEPRIQLTRRAVDRDRVFQSGTECNWIVDELAPELFRRRTDTVEIAMWRLAHTSVSWALKVTRYDCESKFSQRVMTPAFGGQGS